MFYKKYIELCNSKGLTPSYVGLQIGVTKATVSGWKKGSLPRDTQLQKIADYFGVPPSYFSEETPETEKSPMPNDIGEENILRMYRSLSTEEKGALYAYALSLKEKQKEGEYL